MFSFIQERIKSINSGFMISFTILSVIVIMVITTVITVLSFESIDSLSTINLLSIQKSKDLKQLDNIIGKVRELHSNVRDYVITRDSSYIKDIAADQNTVETLLNSFSDSLAPNSSMKKEMILLSNLINRKIAFNLNVLKLYHYGGRDIALEFIETGRAGVLNDSIELLALNVKEVENKELETSVGKYNGAANRTKHTIITASALLILLGFLFMFTTIGNVRQRARIISELEQAKIDSEKAALLKDQFMSNMSHEIRTPLNSIIGFTNLLNATKLNDEQYDFVYTIKNASGNLLRIVNDVLDFSKIEAGMMQIHRHPFSLTEQIRNIEKLFDQTNKKKDLTVQYLLDSSLPNICIGDSVRLNQILINLISNAIKFTNKGTVTVSASVKEVIAENVILEFKIRDTGIGIPQDKLETIFERFEQIHTESTQKPEGTGLGLSIARSLVQMEGGRISVESTEGVGTEFTFTMNYGLPKVNTANYNKDETDLVSRYSTFFPLEGRILVVEDNPLNQKLVGFLLKKWQVDYDVAHNGLQAITMLKDKKYALILMDIQMPEMDGYAATTHIRKKMGLTIPIIALTAHSLDSERNDFIKLGMNGYVTKPFQEVELYNSISRYLSKRGGENGRSVADDRLAPDAPLYRLAELEQLYEGDKAHVKEMAEIFLSQIGRELHTLDEAFAGKDYPRISSVAHSMKSTVSYMGFYADVESILSRMESLSHSTTPIDSLKKDIDLFKLICSNIISQLETELPFYS